MTPTTKLYKYILVEEWPEYREQGWQLVAVQPLKTSRDNLLVAREINGNS